MIRRPVLFKAAPVTRTVLNDAVGELFAGDADTVLFYFAGHGVINPTTNNGFIVSIAEYKTSKEIAEELFISYRTVKTHRANICQKLDLNGSHVLIKFALARKSELL